MPPETLQIEKYTI